MTISKNLRDAFKFNLQQRQRLPALYGDKRPRTTIALALARQDVAAGANRYPVSPRMSALSARFNGYGTDSLRWCERPEDVGLRFVGYAYELAKLDHTGWYADSHNSSLVRGVVYQLPARNGMARYVAGYDNADNGAADAGGPAAIDFGTIWESDKDSDYWESNRHQNMARDAAYRADKLAERMAEESREYDQAWQAGAMWRDLGEEIAEERKTTLDLLRERRLAKAAGAEFPTICATMRQVVQDALRSIREARKTRAKLVAGGYSRAAITLDSIHPPK